MSMLDGAPAVLPDISPARGDWLPLKATPRPFRQEEGRAVLAS